MDDGMFNERAVAGNNAPPVSTEYEKLLERQAELTATASAWLNEIGEIETQEQADRLGGFKKQIAALEKEIKAQFDREREPLKLAAEALKAQFQPLMERCDIMLDLIEPKLRAFLQRQRDEQLKREREAREAAEKAKAEAEAITRRAEEAARAAERGDLAGTGQNTVATIMKAAEAQRQADDAERKAEDIAREKPRAAAGYSSGGINRSVGLREFKKPKVSDLAAAAAFFAADNAPELVEACEKAARRVLKAYPDREIPGIAIEITTKAV